VFLTSADLPVAVVNLEGRVFMNNLDCPFRAADAILGELAAMSPIVLVDFHAETTSEKGAMASYLDGRVSAVLGTHTHVQTADERLMPGGTAFISDVGMTGSRDSVIGIRKELSVERFLTQLPVRFEVAKKEPMLCGVVVTVNETSGRAMGIERVQIVDAE
jgi:metallophosphoesterase (TIGR00282 family)